MHFFADISHSLSCQFSQIGVIGKTPIDHAGSTINASCTWMFVFLFRRYLTVFLLASSLVLPVWVSLHGTVRNEDGDLTEVSKILPLSLSGW